MLGIRQIIALGIAILALVLMTGVAIFNFVFSSDTQQVENELLNP